MNFTMDLFISVVPHGLVARIPGFPPGGPGSIPGVGKVFCFIGHSFQSLCFKGSFFFFLSVVVDKSLFIQNNEKSQKYMVN